MSFYYANVTGLRSKTSRLYVGSSDSCFDVVCLTETWLCGSFADAELFGPEYLVFRRDRHLQTMNAPVGGGVLCAVRRSIPCTFVEFSDSNDLELLCVALKLLNKNILVAAAYIPPGSNLSTYELLASRIDTLSDTLRPCDELVLLGDFNLPSISWELSPDGDGLLPLHTSTSQQASFFVDALASSGLTQCCGVSNDSGRFLDLVFATDPSGTVVRRCMVPLVPDSSHHPALHCVLSFDPVAAASTVQSNNCFNFKKADFSLLNDLLLSSNWANVFLERDIDVAVTAFYDNLFACFIQCVLVSRCNISFACYPWLTHSST